MAQEELPTNSVFDFLYSDAKRIRSWCAQVFPDGVLLSHSKTSQTGESKGDEVSGEIDASASVDAFIADAKVKGSAKALAKTGENLSNSHAKNFDASWSLELDLLSRLDEMGIINRDLSSDRHGQLVLVSGIPKLIDVKFMQEIWDGVIDFGDLETKTTSQNATQKKLQKAKMKAIGEMFKKLPPIPQLYLIDENANNIWACLDEDSMIVSPSSLALTHGTVVFDVWYMLGILDANPENDEFAELIENADEKYELSQIAQLSSGIFGAVRELMGRPKEAYGITPLLIFRKVSQNAQ